MKAETVELAIIRNLKIIELEFGISFIKIDRKNVNKNIIAPRISPPRSHFSPFVLVIIKDVRKTEK